MSPCLQPEVPWEDFCFGMGITMRALGYGGEGTVALGEVLRPEICWGAYTEKRVVGMVSHGIALGQGLLNRLVFPPLERKTGGADD